MEAWRQVAGHSSKDRVFRRWEAGSEGLQEEAGATWWGSALPRVTGCSQVNPRVWQSNTFRAQARG